MESSLVSDRYAGLSSAFLCATVLRELQRSLLPWQSVNSHLSMEGSRVVRGISPVVPQMTIYSIKFGHSDGQMKS